ncbi:MAG: DNA primase, partial [Acidimicrobiales bacterium]
AEPTERQPLPDLRDPRFSLERETLKLLVQYPESVESATADVDADDFTHPTYRAVWEQIGAAGGPQAAPSGEGWLAKLQAGVTEESVGRALSALAVEPVLKQPTPQYVAAHVARLRELTAMRRIGELKSRLQRTNPVEHATEYNRMFGELVALEQHRRALRETAIG